MCHIHTPSTMKNNINQKCRKYFFRKKIQCKQTKPIASILSIFASHPTKKFASVREMFMSIILLKSMYNAPTHIYMKFIIGYLNNKKMKSISRGVRTSNFYLPNNEARKITELQLSGKINPVACCTLK